MRRSENNELMLLGDHWELDPGNVSWGVELGKGAFGVVVTGTINNQKVAVKVLKGRFDM